MNTTHRPQRSARRGAGVAAVTLLALVAGGVAGVAGGASAAEVRDGLSLATTPTSVGPNDAQGFTLVVEDPTPSTSFTDYLLYGVPDGWSVFDGSSKLAPTSPEPAIYTLDKTAAQAGDVRVVAPAGFTGLATSLTIGRVSATDNLITDFDGGTFDYIGTAMPTLDASQTSYVHDNPLTITNTIGYPQYAPYDGEYTIWPTANINGPGAQHINNFWADLRSVSNPMTDPSSDVISKDWDKLSGIDSVNTVQVTEAQSAAAGKLLIVNGSMDLPVPNDLVTTTVTGLTPGDHYTFSGYVANLTDIPQSVADAHGIDTRPVRTAFFIKSSPDDVGSVVGSSGDLPKQASGYNKDTVWQHVTSVVTPDEQGTVTIAVRNFAGGGTGNDLAIDNLSLFPMAKASTDVRVGDGVIEWTKVGPDDEALAGSEWSVEGPDGSIEVVDGDVNDADPAAGALKLEGLGWGTYTLTETRAPDGYTKSDETPTVTVGDGTESVSFGRIVNMPKPGTLTWSKVDPDGAALAGSHWQLTSTNGFDVTIVDNGAIDADPVEGKLMISGLAWDTYTLKETVAPEGYRLVEDEHTLVVDAEHLTLSFGDIENAPLPPTPVDPEEPGPDPTPVDPTPVDPTPDTTGDKDVPVVDKDGDGPAVPSEKDAPAPSTQPGAEVRTGGEVAGPTAGPLGAAIAVVLGLLAAGTSLLVVRRRGH